MHELSLVASMLDIVADQARQHSFTTVTCLHVRFGRLSCIEPQALEFALANLAPGTPAEGARMEYEIVAPEIYCFDCEQNVTCESYTATCPVCGGSQVTLCAGMEELQLVSLDVD